MNFGLLLATTCTSYIQTLTYMYSIMQMNETEIRLFLVSNMLQIPYVPGAYSQLGSRKIKILRQHSDKFK